MNKGKIVQIGTPFDLYDRPESEFAATFIGAMNVFEGEILRLGDGVGEVKTDGDLTMLCPIPQGAKVNDRVTVFVRPEKIRIETAKERCIGNIWEGNMVRRTYSGDHADYTLSVANKEIRVISRPTTALKEGQKVFLSFDKNDCSVIRSG